MTDAASPPLAYVAHPIGPDGPARVANLERAQRWLRWLIATEPRYSFVLPWLPYCQVLDESPENRARGIRDDLAVLRRCDLIVLVGGDLSPGMVVELELARALKMGEIDHLRLGAEPPRPRAADEAFDALAFLAADDPTTHASGCSCPSHRHPGSP